jgi:hypothetical protein
MKQLITIVLLLLTVTTSNSCKKNNQTTKGYLSIICKTPDEAGYIIEINGKKFEETQYFKYAEFDFYTEKENTVKITWANNRITTKLQASISLFNSTFSIVRVGYPIEVKFYTK